MHLLINANIILMTINCQKFVSRHLLSAEPCSKQKCFCPIKLPTFCQKEKLCAFLWKFLWKIKTFRTNWEPEPGTEFKGYKDKCNFKSIPPTIIIMPGTPKLTLIILQLSYFVGRYWGLGWLGNWVGCLCHWDDNLLVLSSVMSWHHADLHRPPVRPAQLCLQPQTVSAWSLLQL